MTVSFFHSFLPSYASFLLSVPALLSPPPPGLVATHQVARRKKHIRPFWGNIFKLNYYRLSLSSLRILWLPLWLAALFPHNPLTPLECLDSGTIFRTAPWPARLDQGCAPRCSNSLYSVVLAIPPKRPKFPDPRTMEDACGSHAGGGILYVHRCRSIRLKDVACRRTSFLCVYFARLSDLRSTVRRTSVCRGRTRSRKRMPGQITTTAKPVSPPKKDGFCARTSGTRSTSRNALRRGSHPSSLVTPRLSIQLLPSIRIRHHTVFTDCTTTATATTQRGPVEG